MSALVQTIVNQWNAHYNARQFQAQVQQHAGMLFATCRRMLRNTADAEDVTQECLEIFARSGMYTQGFAGPWLHGVAVNRCLQKLRSERRLRNHELQFAATLPAWVETKCDDLTPQVDAIVAELHDDLRIPLVAHFFEGKSHAAIARKLGIPRRTISHRIERAVDEVRDGLRRRGIPIAGLLLFMQARTADAAAALLELPEHLRMIKVPSIQLDPRFATAFRWGRMAVATAMIVAVAATVASVVTQAPTQAMHATEPVVAIAAQSERVTSLEPTTPVELVNDFVQSGMWLGMDSNAVSDDTSNSPRGIRLVSDPGRFNYDANQASGLGGLTGHTRAGRTGWNDSTPRAFAVASPPPRRLSQSNTRTSGSFENISELFDTIDDQNVGEVMAAVSFGEQGTTGATGRNAGQGRMGNQRGQGNNQGQGGFSNISELFSTIDDRLVGEVPAVIGLSRPGRVEQDVTSASTSRTRNRRSSQVVNGLDDYTVR